LLHALTSYAVRVPRCCDLCYICCPSVPTSLVVCPFALPAERACVSGVLQQRDVLPRIAESRHVRCLRFGVR
jgi:hypothetical protein